MSTIYIANNTVLLKRSLLNLIEHMTCVENEICFFRLMVLKIKIRIVFSNLFESFSIKVRMVKNKLKYILYSKINIKKY